MARRDSSPWRAGTGGRPDHAEGVRSGRRFCARPEVRSPALCKAPAVCETPPTAIELAAMDDRFDPKERARERQRSRNEDDRSPSSRRKERAAAQARARLLRVPARRHERARVGALWWATWVTSTSARCRPRPRAVSKRSPRAKARNTCPRRAEARSAGRRAPAVRARSWIAGRLRRAAGRSGDLIDPKSAASPLNPRPGVSAGVPAPQIAPPHVDFAKHLACADRSTEVPSQSHPELSESEARRTGPLPARPWPRLTASTVRGARRARRANVRLAWWTGEPLGQVEEHHEN